MPVHSRVTTPSAFATGKTKRVPVETGSPVYGEDLFAIKYWRGSDEFYDIKNGIDLENKGGLVWVKQAAGSSNQPMIWFDTLAGVQKYYTIDNASYQQTDSQAIVSFNTDGFRIGSNNNWNHNNVNGFVCYTWAKHEKFFTMLTYEGDGNGTRNISHDLNGELGMVIVKSQSDAGTEDRNGWIVWQRGQNSQTSPGDMHNFTFFNKDNGPSQDNGYFTNSTLPADPGMTRTHIRVGNNLNVTGILYHVYIWGHNELPEDCIFGPEKNKPMVFNGIIPDNSQNFKEQNMGMPVQWLLSKNNAGWGDYGSSYRVIDKMRGMNAISDSPWFSVRAQSPQVQEGSYGSIGYKSGRGFTLNGQFGGQGAIYMGIGDSAYKNVSENTTLNPTARGVIQSKAQDGEPTILQVGGNLGSGSDVDRPTRSLDFTIVKRTSSTSGSGANAGPTNLINRVTGNKYTYYAHTSGSADTFADDEGTNPNRSRVNGGFYRMAGMTQPYTGASSPGWLFMRPPLISASGRVFAMALSTHRKFFDVQCYNGVATNKTVYHNLEFEPAMIWIKVQSGTPWTVYHKDVGLSYRMSLGSSTGKVAYTSGQGGIVSVDAEKVVLSNGTLTNDTNVIHTMYLFANYPGWSKIGLYNGTGSPAAGSNLDIDCGFSPTDGVLNTANGGPANLLIKRVDTGSDGSWYMWNSHYDNIWQYTQASGQRAMKLDETGDQWSSGMIKEWIKRNPGETGFRLNAVAQNIMNYAGPDAVTHNFNLTASGSSAYTFASATDRLGSVSGNNPTITVYTGDSIGFYMNAAGHPLYIRVSNGGANVSTPAASGQGSDTSPVGWVPNTAGTYYYQCGNHSAMIGQIVVLAAPVSEYIYWAVGPDNTPP